MEKFNKKDLLLVSLMIFSMFFGAGNLIIPPIIGEQSGTKVLIGSLGFLVSAVGLPVLAIGAVAKAGGLHILAKRVHKNFALIFTILVYVSIGPLLGIPRAASLAFEMGVGPFISSGDRLASYLFMYSLVYFAIAYWLSLSPSKLVDRFGKVLTPSLLLLIALVFIASVFKPLKEPVGALASYNDQAFLSGFLDGYLTMDAIAALNFGIVISIALRNMGLKDEDLLVKETLKAGLIAGSLLAIVYLSLAYLGAGAQASFGPSENGAQTLTNIVFYLFGQKGSILLGLIFSLACLTTSVGLLTSCSQYFSEIMPFLSYKKWISLLTISSLFFANIGLSKILKISVPILNFIYPMAIVLILLGIFNDFFPESSKVYTSTVFMTGLVASLDLLSLLGIDFGIVEHFPLYESGLAWFFPALGAFFLGLFWDKFDEDQKKIIKTP